MSPNLISLISPAACSHRNSSRPTAGSSAGAETPNPHAFTCELQHSIYALALLPHRTHPRLRQLPRRPPQPRLPPLLRPRPPLRRLLSRPALSFHPYPPTKLQFNPAPPRPRGTRSRTGEKEEPRPNLEEPAKIGRVGFPRVLCRRGGGGDGRISDAGEWVVAAVDGEVAEDIPDD